MILGNSFYRLNLENLWVWSKWFPIDPDTLKISAFKLSVERLIIEGVHFCQLIYYDPAKVIENMPSEFVPIPLLRQC